MFDEQYRLYPDDRAKAVQETIRICKEKDVLKTYLEREEAAAVMFTFAAQVDAMNEALLTESAEGEKNGEIRGAIKTYRRMGKLPTEIIDLIKEDFDLEQDVAEKYVEETLGLLLA